MNDDLQRKLRTYAIFVGLPVLFLLLPPTQPTMFATLGVFAHGVLWLFDCALGAEAFGISPVVMWSVLGGIFGACLGFWSVAPAVGRRRYRRVAAAIPLVVMGCLLIGDVLFSIMQSPRPVSLRPPNAPVIQQVQPKPTGPTVADPNNEPAPSLYSVPKEEILSTAPEGGGGDPHDRSVVPIDTAGGTAGTTTSGQAAPTSNNPVDRLRGLVGGGNNGTKGK